MSCSADLNSDPLNCGACERTCVIPNANPACVKGECAIASCFEGFYDTDRKVETGCEAMSRCIPGSECKTTCESMGTVSCQGGMALCQAPAESCNGTDDDCNGRCDEGALAGCRVGVHRASGNGGHFYTTDLAVVQKPPYTLEAQNYFFLYKTGVNGTQAVYLCPKPDGKYFLTASTTCESLNIAGRVLGYWAPSPRCQSIPLYRLYSPKSGDHFYTTSDVERQAAISMYGYMGEGIAGHVYAGP